jgi:dTDP-4-amino-4,6-dideoxygalactose transaminase
VSETGPIVPFNRPHLTGKELEYIGAAADAGQLAGDGAFTKKCQDWLETSTGAKKALLTNSCTAALEMAAILAEIGPGDEVIMPSYTFVSTANAFVLRGGVPVFVDIREDTLNLDESLIEEAVTPRTKAIVPVHYAGVSCDMDAIMDVAQRHGLLVIEDAAQGIMSSYRDRSLGSIGHLACLSFHETKNIISGHGGALLINDERFTERAEIIREKGTNRSQFFRGLVDRYTWVDIGSSFLPGEVTAAFLWAQMEQAEAITAKRIALWSLYHGALERCEAAGVVRRPVVPSECKHNAHMYHIVMGSPEDRAVLVAALAARGLHAVFHYVPLHSSPAGMRVGRVSGNLRQTDTLAERVLRLPFWLGLGSDSIQCVVAALDDL